MADKRVFTIEINGISESYHHVENLRKALDGLPVAIEKINKTSLHTTKAVEDANKAVDNANKKAKERKATLTEEEKDENKLAQAIDRVVTARTESKRALIDANTAAKAAQREVQLEQNVINAASNSIEGMRANLALLRNEWKKTDINSDKFAELTDQIALLNTELVEAERKTGDNSRVIGNYENATVGLREQLDELSNSIDGASRYSKDMLTLFQTGVTAFALFGDESETTKEVLTQTSKVMAALSLVQQFNNGLFSKSIVIEKAKIVTDALVTRGLITQTTAQTALNIATAAFPLLAIIALLGTFIALTSTATEKTNSFKSSMDGVSFATKEARDKHDDFVRRIRDIQIEIDIANGKLTEYEANLLKLANMRIDAYAKADSKVADALKESSNQFKEDANSWAVTFDFFTGAYDKAKRDREKRDKEAIKDYREDLTRAKEEADNKDELQNAQHNAAINKQNEDNRIANLTGLEQNLAKIKQVREKELQQAEKDGADINLINQKYDKEIRDARASTAKEANAKQVQQLEKRKATLQKELELIRKSEDDETSLMKDQFERRNKQIESQYTRQREDLQRQLDTDKTLTEQGQEAIRKVIANVDQHIKEDQKAIAKEKNEKLLSDQKSYLDMLIADYQRAYADIAYMPTVIRQKGGLIDVEASKKNFDAVNNQLLEYAKNLKASKTDVIKYYDDLAATYDKDSIEYAQATDDKKAALHQIDLEVKSVNKEIAENTKDSLGLQAEYWQEYSQKVTEFMGTLANISSSIFDSMNAITQMSIDSSKEKLEELTKAYDDAVAKREESDSRLEELSERAKTAEGSRSAALITQLNKEMEKNKALADQETSLAKQKQQLEADIAKKEQKQRKANAAQQVFQSAVNTSLAVTAVLPNIVKAAIVGSLGAAQTAIAAANYAKMEKGGEIKGKRHSQGGEIRELEDGEFVVNRTAAHQNKSLLEYINNNNTTPQLSPSNKVNVSDLVSNTYNYNSTILSDSSSEMISKLDSLNESIKNIQLKPVVSVLDIARAESNVSVIDNITNT